MTERERMLNGELYDSADADLASARRRARDLCRNLERADSDEERRAIVRELLGSAGDEVTIEPPFRCDYGANIRVGDRVYFNVNCVVLDPAEVVIGSDVLFGPGVQLYTASHPVDFRIRRTWRELARPIVIGSDVWIGGGAIVCPGVRIGDRSVIGAGSVVARDVPAGVLAVGNPCRVVRELP